MTYDPTDMTVKRRPAAHKPKGQATVSVPQTSSSPAPPKRKASRAQQQSKALAQPVPTHQANKTRQVSPPVQQRGRPQQPAPQTQARKKPSGGGCIPGRAHRQHGTGTRRTTVTFPPSTLQQLDALAHQRGLSRTALLCQLVLAEVSRTTRPAPVPAVDPMVLMTQFAQFMQYQQQAGATQTR